MLVVAYVTLMGLELLIPLRVRRHGYLRRLLVNAAFTILVLLAMGLKKTMI